MTLQVRATESDKTLIEHFRQARRDKHHAVLEGFHALKHALRFGAEIECAFSPDPTKLAQLASELAPDIAEKMSCVVEPLAPSVFSNLAPRAPETGVLTLTRRPAHDLGQALSSDRTSPAILLEEPAHLGNVGAAIRVAAAAGAGAVITTGPHDPWDPAAIRGSAGLHFAQPVLHVSDLPASAKPLIAIHPEGDPMEPKALAADAIFAFGSERRGLSSSLLDRADQRLSIPMESQVSSLNLATAVAVTLYAWRLNAHTS